MAPQAEEPRGKSGKVNVVSSTFNNWFNLRGARYMQDRVHLEPPEYIPIYTGITIDSIRIISDYILTARVMLYLLKSL